MGKGRKVYVCMHTIDDGTGELTAEAPECYQHKHSAVQTRRFAGVGNAHMLHAGRARSDLAARWLHVHRHSVLVQTQTRPRRSRLRMDLKLGINVRFFHTTDGFGSVLVYATHL